MNSGPLSAALAFVMWGLFPLYFRALAHVPPLQVLAHRIGWSLAFVLLVLVARRRWGGLLGALRRPRVLAVSALSATLLSSNWLVYIWAVHNGHVVEASLGYFINPLVNVVLGFAVLHERLRRVQWAAVALAAAGVAWLTWQGGQPPWIALFLAATFATYGLLRKTAPLGPLDGLALETLLLTPLALGAIALWVGSGTDAFVAGDAATRWLLAAAGPVTAVPLLLFAAGARRITLATLGLLQYIGPTLQLLLGVWLFGEPFGAERAIGFGAIWLALALYSAEGLWHSRRAPR
ncbi:EamA family transporter RarD [Caldimonas tepidiphila]|uniref:EamA family transporter RarD n=1 Tax=Caldimonas tepidiphila TaxID=2315841 RepID=UPI000E5A2806|nr:EamA family transporter RarD [Caldimonas tepidiphila]